jgi:hypothetical protein
MILYYWFFLLFEIVENLQMARKPAVEELEKRMFGRSYFLEAEEGFRRH